MKTLKQKFSTVSAKLESMDRGVKGLKGNDVQKMKVLIEKSENDDRLIEALKQEVGKLRKQAESQAKIAGPEIKENPYV